MDKLLEQFGSVADISRIEPFEHVRDMQAFHVGEGTRANVTARLAAGQIRALKKRIETRKAKILSNQNYRTKWQAQAAAEADTQIQEWLLEISELETLVEVYEALRDGYYKYADALGREISARINDRDRWYGRTGSGK